MVYRAIGIMSGSSLDGLDIAFAEFHENAGHWTYSIKAADCLPYSEVWSNRLKQAIHLPALEYQLLHTDYGHYIGQQVNDFITKYQLQYQVSLVSSHGHTTFHVPARKMTAQLGDGASIAAETGLPVVSDLRAVDMALGGQGAPIVPIGEKLLLQGYDYFLNLGGIANISVNAETYVAFDVCPANRVLNLLVNELGKEFDEEGSIASTGEVNTALLERLNQLDYYSKPFPKSLANDFGTDVIYPLIRSAHLSIPDSLRTYSEHIAIQISNAIAHLKYSCLPSTASSPGLVDGPPPISHLLATGGGAFNDFLIAQLKEKLQALDVELIVPDPDLVNYKEALVMAFIGVLRWRQENNVFASVTGASRDSIGGALWTGQDA
jgi:anhydro-N-acetylmuramic acid kinase